ncbi:acyltransferase [Neiella marina]|uniref:Acyltransferase n=1 Tax=Neiella holothuriorum TaxID=2870530 RepID=A0ABS7EC30_9GAMM|nr:acyltransferase family protein [Neiella holothuriorum]MBW8189888.1 acyltransferase [Neiella holothuriorum]
MSSFFRAEIQGLRALAVISVVLYHVTPHYLPGGFVGVDAFFVISGYLIIGFIYRDLIQGKFSFLDFYRRRVQRLMPAYLFVLVPTAILCAKVLGYADFDNYISSLLSSLLYVSNFWFYSQTGYFDFPLHSSALLHTWSLSVEEQFYIIFPIVIVLLYKFLKRWMFYALGAMALASFALSEWFLSTNESFVFFGSQFRFWQFIVGGFIAMNQVSPPKQAWVRESITATGLLALLVCFVFYDKEQMSFPGVNALLPTFATAMILYACRAGDWTHRALSIAPMRYVGDISYSLYLWHWPVFVLFSLIYGVDLSLLDRLWILVISVGLASVTYHLVEEPTRKMCFRARPWLPIQTSITVCALVSVSIVPLKNWKESLYSEDQLNYADYLNYGEEGFRLGECFLTKEHNSAELFNKDTCLEKSSSKQSLLLIGDSHAAHWYSALNELVSSEYSISQVTASGCKPTVQYKGETRCTDLVKWAYDDLIVNEQFDVVILAGRWTEEDADYLGVTVERIALHADKVIVFGPVLEYRDDLPRILARVSKEEVASFNNYQKIQQADQELKLTTKNTNATYVSILDQMCQTPMSCTTLVNNSPMQFDYGHLTHDGALYVLQQLAIFGTGKES